MFNWHENSFYNRTEDVIVVEANNQKVTIIKSAIGEIFDHALIPTFPMIITSITKPEGGFVRKYNIVPLPQSYVRPLLGGIKGYEILLQIEPNGFIYVLLPESEMPALQIEAQPSSFP